MCQNPEKKNSSELATPNKWHSPELATPRVRVGDSAIFLVWQVLVISEGGKENQPPKIWGWQEGSATLYPLDLLVPLGPLGTGCLILLATPKITVPDMG